MKSKSNWEDFKSGLKLGFKSARLRNLLAMGLSAFFAARWPFPITGIVFIDVFVVTVIFFVVIWACMWMFRWIVNKVAPKSPKDDEHDG